MESKFLTAPALRGGIFGVAVIVVEAGPVRKNAVGPDVGVGAPFSSEIVPGVHRVYLEARNGKSP